MTVTINADRVGYTRVSSLDQNLDRQLEGIALDKAFAHNASGKNATRPQLEALLGFVREGDTVIVHSMDRLARNLDDLRHRPDPHRPRRAARVRHRTAHLHR